MNPSGTARSATSRLTRRTLAGGAMATAALVTARPGLGFARARTPANRNMNAQEANRMTDATPDPSTPTVVLVHGAFADSSSWSGVIERLQAQQIPVVAIQNELRGLMHDATYVASAINQIAGPVLVVGHSYGGAVISQACTATPNVVGLIYVAAFAPEIGETLLAIEGKSKDSVLSSALVEQHYPSDDGGKPAVEYVIGCRSPRNAGGCHAGNAAPCCPGLLL
jgi:pimeloyl-ACP methyl ester carboxylesterase